jgi:hypothetical protein
LPERLERVIPCRAEQSTQFRRQILATGLFAEQGAQRRLAYHDAAVGRDAGPEQPE